MSPAQLTALFALVSESSRPVALTGLLDFAAKAREGLALKDCQQAMEERNMWGQGGRWSSHLMGFRYVSGVCVLPTAETLFCFSLVGFKPIGNMFSFCPDGLKQMEAFTRLLLLWCQSFKSLFAPLGLTGLFVPVGCSKETWPWSINIVLVVA